MKIPIFDVKHWSKLYNTYFQKDNELTIEQLNSLILSKKYKLIYAKSNDYIIGILIYAVLPNNSFYIEYLCVDSNFQHLGIGKKLIFTFFQNIPSDASCGLNCEKHVIEYYQKFGFILDPYILEYQNQTFFTMVKGNITGKKLLEKMIIDFWQFG